MCVCVCVCVCAWSKRGGYYMCSTNLYDYGIDNPSLICVDVVATTSRTVAPVYPVSSTSDKCVLLTKNIFVHLVQNRK